MIEEWENLLIDVAIAKNHQVLNVGDHQSLNIEQFESVIVSGLLIRSISILDKGLENYIDANNLQYNVRNPKLYHPLSLFNSSKLLVDYTDIDRFRVRRNEIGHEVNGSYTWDKLDDCLCAEYTELSNLNILEDHPELTLEGKIQIVESTAQGIKIK